jgi:hypothetical protein
MNQHRHSLRPARKQISGATRARPTAAAALLVATVLSLPFAALALLQLLM